MEIASLYAVKASLTFSDVPFATALSHLPHSQPIIAYVYYADTKI